MSGKSWLREPQLTFTGGSSRFICPPKHPLTCAAPTVWPCPGGSRHYLIDMLPRLRGTMPLLVSPVSSAPNAGKNLLAAPLFATVGVRGSVWGRSSGLGSLCSGLTLV